jgi:hypothetical protein
MLSYFVAGVCDKVNEQHGRHLPMMNGIKEDIKTLLTLELGSPLFHEVLVNLSVRLKRLQVQTLRILIPVNCIKLFLNSS